LGEFIFKIQKRIPSVIMSYSMRDCCCELFRGLNILLLLSQYIFPLHSFIIQNGDQFLINLKIQDINRDIILIYIHLHHI